MEQEPLDPITAAVDSTMEVWRQGDVIWGTAFHHFADARRPVTEQATTAAKQSTSERTTLRITTQVAGLVVITQTCDIVRSCRQRPFVEVCPLVQVSTEIAQQADAGERPQYAALPHLGPDFVADLDRVMTLEKGYLSLLPRVSGWNSDDQIRRFQAAVARRYSRFAFPDDFTRTMQRLREKIVSRHGKSTSPEGFLFGQVRQIRVSANPHWNAPRIEAILTFILPPGTHEPLPEELTETQAPAAARQWLAAKQRTSHEIAERLTSEPDVAARDLLWVRLAEAWAASTGPAGTISAVYGEVVDANEYSVARYWESAQLDLDHLSEAPVPLNDAR